MADPILAIKLGAFGDLLLALGALADIRAAHAAPLAVLTRRPYAALLARCPWVDEVLVDPALPRWRPDGWWRLQRQLRGRRFARVYDLQNSRRSRAYRRWLLRGIPASALDPACEFPADPALRRRPLPERLAAQLLAAGVPPRQASAPDLSWMPVPVAGLLAAAGVGGSFVALLPGASRRHPDKRWPHFPSLAVRLAAAGVTAVTIPGPEEPEIGAGWPGIVLRAAGGRPLDPFELAGALARAAAVVGNDSGPTHLAALLGRPGVALFGAASPPPELTGLDRRLAVLRARTLAELAPETVAEALFAQLACAAP